MGRSDDRRCERDIVQRARSSARIRLVAPGSPRGFLTPAAAPRSVRRRRSRGAPHETRARLPRQTPGDLRSGSGLGARPFRRAEPFDPPSASAMPGPPEPSDERCSDYDCCHAFHDSFYWVNGGGPHGAARSFSPGSSRPRSPTIGQRWIERTIVAGRRTTGARRRVVLTILRAVDIGAPRWTPVS